MLRTAAEHTLSTVLVRNSDLSELSTLRQSKLRHSHYVTFITTLSLVSLFTKTGPGESTPTGRDNIMIRSESSHLGTPPHASGTERDYPHECFGATQAENLTYGVVFLVR